MSGSRYLVVGGGMAADTACKAIREHDSDAAITLVGAEPHPPYNRPPLTKGLWHGDDEGSIWRGTEEAGVELVLGRRIVALDPAAHRAVDAAGEAYEYDRALLVTGGRPRRLPAANGDVVYFRTLDDYRRVRALAKPAARFVVVGGGFIGSELAASLVSTGCAVSMVFPEAGIGARIFPGELSAFVTDYYRERGIDVHAGRLVAGGDDGRVRLDDGVELEADAVVAGLGIEPAIELAGAAGIETADGIVVDELGRTSAPDVFAAGDVARFPVAALGGTARVEHEDHAKSHGRAVGANMAGAGTPYRHLPFFYSDLFDLGYEAVGETDPRLRTMSEWREPNRTGVVCYLDDDDRPRGFLLWGVFGQVDAATALIAARERVDAATLRTLLG
ncbi:MAG TPA: FAD-dependent oxidoreductase [Gaiellaceae bacterium]|nr:FAD-dependent oxidoreductase [Gaiellaceae bacterium]